MKRAVVATITSAIILAIGSCSGSAQRASRPAHTSPAPTAGTAVALVMSTLPLWLGNEEYEQDPVAVYAGGLNALKLALDKLDVGHRLPAGSRTVVVGYERGARIVHPMSPATELKGSVLGVEKDYEGGLATDLVAGVQLAFDELSNVDATRKVIVVLGDGNDTNSDTARPRLAALAARAANDHIELFALVLKSPVSRPANAIEALTPHVTVMSSSSDIYPELTAIFPPR